LVSHQSAPAVQLCGGTAARTAAGASDERLALLARSLFSAVHGVVELGLDEKLQPLPVDVLREQVAAVAAAIGRGMAQA
jgi:hypothetical protein